MVASLLVSTSGNSSNRADINVIPTLRFVSERGGLATSRNALGK
jgi:hypothetical protein